MIPHPTFAVRPKPYVDNGTLPDGTPLPVAQDVNKRLPYMPLPGGERSVHWNNLKQFASGKLTRTTLNGKFGPPDRVVSCRHFAAMYCEQSLQDSGFHPQAFASTCDITQADPTWMDELDWYTDRHAHAVHLLPARRFPEFVVQEFQAMLAELQARGTAQDGSVVCRVYYATTHIHAMAVRLKIKTRPDGQRAFVVHVYNPNYTTRHVTCRTDSLDDFSAHPQDYHFLAFLVSGDAQDAPWRDGHRHYFPAIDTDQHIQFFHLRDVRARSEAHAPMATSWSTHPRIALIYATQANNRASADVAWDELLPPEGPLATPATLQELLGVDSSLLLRALFDAQPRYLQAWQWHWSRQPPPLKVSLLRGHTIDGRHLMCEAADMPDAQVEAWFRLVHELPVADAIQVLTDRDATGGSALGHAMAGDHAALVRRWAPLVQRLLAQAPDAVADVLEARDALGHSALSQTLSPAKPLSVGAWTELLRGANPATLARLLRGAPAPQAPLLERALQLNEPGWIQAWGAGLALVQDTQTRQALLRLTSNGDEHPMAGALARDGLQAAGQWATLVMGLPMASAGPLLACIDANEHPLWLALFKGALMANARGDDASPALSALAQLARLYATHVPADQTHALAPFLSVRPNKGWVLTLQTLARQDLRFARKCHALIAPHLDADTQDEAESWIEC